MGHEVEVGRGVGGGAVGCGMLVSRLVEVRCWWARWREVLVGGRR